MESLTWPESLPSNRIQAIQELTHGQELMNILREMLWRPKMFESNYTSEDGLVVQILEMFENTFSIMSSCSSNESIQPISSDFHTPCSSDEQKSKGFNESLKLIIPVKIKRGCYKRRKNSSTSTQIASVLVDDGHAWRKYGQKEIINAKYQRSYYRCTYKFDQGCQATKHVQKINDKPPKYKTTYIGEHTCKDVLRAPQIILDSPDPRDTSILLNFKTNLGFVPKKQIDPNFQAIKGEVKAVFPCIGNTRHNGQTSWDPNTCVSKRPFEPLTMTSSMLAQRDMIPLEAYSYMGASTHGCEMEDHMHGRNDFPYELCF